MLLQKSIMCDEQNIDLSKKIIEYLSRKDDQKDDFEGITLFVYEKETKELSGMVLNAIGDLLSKGLLKESEDLTGRKYYHLSELHSPQKNFF